MNKDNESPYQPRSKLLFVIAVSAKRIQIHYCILTNGDVLDLRILIGHNDT